LSSERPLNQYNRKEIFFWLALKRIPGIGNVIYKRLIEKFHTPEGVFQATPAELKEIEGIRPKTIEAITNNFRDEEWVNRELDRVEKLGIKILTINDRLYPQILKNIYDPPPIL
jgi:DNA processing protein